MLTLYKFKLYYKTTMVGKRYVTVYKIKLHEDQLTYEHVVNIPQQYLNPDERRVTRKIHIGSFVILGTRKVRKYT